MKSNPIAGLKAGDELLNEPYLLQDLARRKTKDGRPFLLCTLSDQTGRASSVFWDVPEHVDAWARPGQAVLVSGRVVTFKDALQINVTDMNPSGQHIVDLLPTSQRPRDEMIAELRRYVDHLAEPWQELVSILLLDDEFLPVFATAPAARTMHHAYVGGLLEHTLSMAAVAEMLAQHYPYVNKDLLLAGILLHDMGKTLEYSLEDAFGYSDDGRLVGHIVRAVALVEAAAARLGNFPEDMLRHLIHLIVSHHGAYEWGSPVTPKTLEAILLHQIDLLDSRVQGFFDHLNNDRGSEAWTTRPSPMFNTELRRPPTFTNR